MIFARTAVEGVLEIAPEPHEDERGGFARVYCRDEFAAQGLDFAPIQISVSTNRNRGTLRGLHYQLAPAEERKVVRCTAGEVFDVAVDLRPGSPTFRRWAGARLSPANGKALYIPGGCAHGFLTLSDEAHVEYFIDTAFAPALARGARWDDPAFGIRWPFAPLVMSDKDRGWPLQDG